MRIFLSVKQTNTLIYKRNVGQSTLLSMSYRNLFLSLAHLFTMECAIIFIGIILPLSGLFFYQAFPGTQLSRWLLLPTYLLFPGKAMISPVHDPNAPPASLSIDGQETMLLLVGFIALFTLYLLAIHTLPRYISHRYLLLSTLILGVTYAFIPVITSQDLFSYIGYAHIGVIYHLNPLTTPPTAIHTDPVYPYIFWVHQPSAYGPLWVIITSALQWLSLLFGSNHILSMVLLLRVFGLATHLGSTLLIWHIGDSLQRWNEVISPHARLAATLAFAWNPLLLFEACVNAHNDTAILFLILLALWFLQLQARETQQLYLLAVASLALAACIKISFLLLAPGILLFLWSQQPRRINSIVFATLAYAGILLLLYVPFWQHGNILQLFQINPGTTRDINSLYDFLIRLYASIRGKSIPFVSSDTGSPTEITTHRIGTVIFIIVYGVICLLPLLTRGIKTLPALIRWMALVWFLYCLIGSPWFWPWYIVTFFGLAALLIATSSDATLGLVRLPIALQLLTFSMLSVYCFFTWWPHIILIPHLPYFQLSYIRGLWVWGVLALAINTHFLSRWKDILFRNKKAKMLSTTDNPGDRPPREASAPII